MHPKLESDVSLRFHFVGEVGGGGGETQVWKASQAHQREAEGRNEWNTNRCKKGDRSVEDG